MRFECKGYGDCCRNLRQKNAERAKKFSSVSVLNLAMNQDEIALPLFDWELESIQELAKDYISIRPLWIFLDRNSVPVVVMWSLDHDECPFLKNNKCSVYNDRPGICRSFPVTSSGIIQLASGGKNIDINSSNACRCWKETMPKAASTAAEMFKTAYGIFGDSYIGALKYDMQFIFVTQVLQELVNRGMVRPEYVDVKRSQKLLSRGSIGFVDFLEKERIITRKEIGSRLENIDRKARSLVGVS